MSFGKTFSALSDPIRREILVKLKEKRMSAGEITACFEISGAAISYHLNKLKAADLIRETKYKNFIYYELNATILDEVLLWIKQLKEGDNNNEG